MKDPLLRDNPPLTGAPATLARNHGEYDRYEHLYDKGHPDNHALYRDVRAMLDSYRPERFSVGEIHIADWEEWASYYGDLDELHLPFNFSLVHCPWTPEDISRAIAELDDPGQLADFSAASLPLTLEERQSMLANLVVDER